MEAIYLIVIVILLVIYFRREEVVSGGGRSWKVIGSFSNKKEAANLLSNINITLIKFMKYLKNKYQIDLPGANPRKTRTWKIVDYLLDNYNPDHFYENDPRWTTTTSYTINKGDSVYICMRNKNKPDQLIDIDTMLFVMLHEMSHIGNFDGWGHDKQFWTVFKFILYEATLAGIYKPVDYQKYPRVYCGLTINYNPLYDTALDSLWLQ